MNIITSISLQRGNVEMQDRAEKFRFGERTVLALADGAGGISGGAEAAELFITMVRESSASLQNADDCVRLLAMIDAEVANRKECGETTGVVIGINHSDIFGASVGDSAAKLIGSNSTDDLTRGQRRKPFLGTGNALAQGFVRNLVEGTLVIGSDGLWKYTGAELIEERTRTCDPTQLAMQLMAITLMTSRLLHAAFPMIIDPRLHNIVAAQPYSLLFATISGAHLYGFPSPDSDFDLRGAHVLPLEKVIGLEERDETLEDSRVIEGMEMDIVSHDVKKFFGLLLKKNGYVLEQLFSPLIVQTTPEHEELKAICCQGWKTTSPRPSPPQAAERENCSQRSIRANASGVITKHHSHHYFGFAETQWKLFEKENPRRVKPLLYVFRVLLTGIHLMRTGKVNANLIELNEEFRLPYIADLVARKQSGENTTLQDADVAFYQREYARLRIELQAAHDASQLPEVPSDETRAALNDLLVRIRLQTS